MTGLVALLSKLADRPSTIWRISWLAFCLIVVCLFGARTLRRIAPYVLAGVGHAPTPPLLPDETTGQQSEDDGRFANLVLPAVCWSFVAAALSLLILNR